MPRPWEKVLAHYPQRRPVIARPRGTRPTLAAHDEAGPFRGHRRPAQETFEQELLGKRTSAKRAVAKQSRAQMML